MLYLALTRPSIAGCSADQELRELRHEDGWILGTVIPFDENELVILDRPAQPSKLAILECDPQGKCEVLTVDPLTGSGVGTALFYPVEDGIVFSISNLIYHYRPEEKQLINFQLLQGASTLYVIDKIIYTEAGGMDSVKHTIWQPENSWNAIDLKCAEFRQSSLQQKNGVATL